MNRNQMKLHDQIMRRVGKNLRQALCEAEKPEKLDKGAYIDFNEIENPADRKNALAGIKDAGIKLGQSARKNVAKIDCDYKNQLVCVGVVCTVLGIISQFCPNPGDALVCVGMTAITGAIPGIMKKIKEVVRP